MSEFKQSNFTGGEIAPTMYGRSDLPKYAQSARRMQNFYPLITGAAVNRPGTKFLGLGGYLQNGSLIGRLIPFRYTNDQNYMIAIEGDAFTVWYRGTLLAINGAAKYRLMPVGWNGSDYSRYKFVQIGAQLILVCRGEVPQVITRVGHNDWTVSNYSFARTQVAPTGVAAANGAAPPTAIVYAVTAVDANGNESLPALSLATLLAPDPTNPATNITWIAAAGAVYYKIYRGGATGLQGLLGTSGKEIHFVYRYGMDADYSKNPPTGETASLFAAADDYPGVVSYFDQRTIFGGTNNNPKTLWFSKIGKQYDFDRQVGQPADGPIYATLSSPYFDEIRSLIPHRKLFAFTGGSEFTIAGAADGVLGPASIEARPQLNEGSSWVDPILISSMMLHIMSSGNVVSEVGFNEAGFDVKGNDLTVLVRHLLDGHSIRDWAYARVPNNTIWIVRNDGKMLSLTYSKEQEVWGWAYHETNSGTLDVFLNVCAVFDGVEDVVYVSVTRYKHDDPTQSLNCVEQLTSRNLPINIDGVQQNDLIQENMAFCFLDHALYYDGQRNALGGTKTASLSALSGSIANSTGTLTVALETPFTANSIGDIITLGYATVRNTGRLPTQWAATTQLRLEITGYTSTTVVSVKLIDALPSPYTVGSPPTTIGDYAIAVKRFAVTQTFAGETRYALVDGQVQGPFLTVDDGGTIIVTLDSPGVKVWIGIQIEAELETLDLFVPQQSIRTKVKGITKMALEVAETRGITVGVDETVLQGWPQRQEADGYDPEALYTGLVEIGLEGGWDKNGRVVIRQTDPLPVTVLSIIREVEIGGGNA